jgi:hypothetical protein
MRYHEFKRQLGKAGLTVKEFALLIYQNPNSISNYSKSGIVPPHLAVISALMGDMADAGLDYKCTLSKLKLSENKSKAGAKKGKFGGNKQITLSFMQKLKDE